ncbi:MAG: excinuclease ABC subunit C [Omnitrophica WOR_2 bacterium RIFCSPLOWO2_01_FULL_41_12]|nr:MAG: excinuclease ABC subunit C [Omnitrophica WOR_2 bacterium RIFCSPLOWO2_01_FULL_41_12]
MNIVYILTSKKHPIRYYIGLTQDLKHRIKEHNNGDSLYTKRYMPWELQTYITFRNKARAEEFEKYLKSGSGFAFLKRRFL